MKIPEHTIVKTISYISEGTTVIPLNSIGTIVHVYPKGYEVEFIINDSSEVISCPENSIIPHMSLELKRTLELKAKGYRYVVQITTNDKPFGEPLFLKSADEAGPLLRDFSQDQHAKIAWSKPIERYIDTLCVHEDRTGKGKYGAGYPATCAICGLTF